MAAFLQQASLNQPGVLKRPRVSLLVATLGVVLLVLGAPASAQLIFSDDFESGYADAWSAVVGALPVTAFRMDDLDLRDPHVVTDVPLLGCFDFTDQDIPLVAPSFNNSIEAAITTDDDGDGLLDASFMLLFRPLDEASAGDRLDSASGDCTAPLAGTTCVPAAPPTALVYQTQGSGLCLVTEPGSTSGYSPGIDEPSAPCFGTQATDLTVDLSGVPVTLRDASVAATFVGTEPPSSLMLGLLSGFLTEADADSILIPADTPLVGGQPLSVLLPGGTGNCSASDDRDMHDGEMGWWFYLNFTALPAPWTE